MKKLYLCLLLAATTHLSATVVTLSSRITESCNVQTGIATGGGACTDPNSANTNVVNSILAGATAANPVRLIVDGGVGVTGVVGPAAGNWEIDCVNGGGFFVVSGANANIITDGVAVSPPPGPAPSRGANVTIKGCYLNGHRNAGNFPNTNSTSGEPRGNPYWLFGVFLSNLQNVTIQNNTVYDAPTYGFLFSNVAGVIVTGNRVIAPSFVYNTDGFHFDGPSSDIHLTDDYCDEGDDCVALNAPEGYGGDIKNVYMDSINFYHVNNAVRIYTSYTSFGASTAWTSDNVTLENSSGHATQSLFNFSSSGGGEILAPNQIRSFQVLNSTFTVDNGGPMIPMTENVGLFQLNGLVINGTNANLLDISGGATLANLSIVSYIPGTSAGIGSFSSISSISGSGVANTGFLLPDANVANNTLYLSAGGDNCPAGSLCDKTNGTTFPVAGVAGIVASIPMNEGSGQLLHDTANSADNLTGSDITWVSQSGITGLVPHFTGNGAATAGATQENFERTQAFSGCAWVNFDSVNGYQDLMGDILYGPQWQGWVFGLYPGGLILKLTYDESVGNQLYITSSSPGLIAPGTLYHTCFTYDGTSGNGQGGSGTTNAAGVGSIKLYVNGNPVATYTNANALTGTALNSNIFYVGALTGTQADTRLWNRVLSSAEISAIYAAGAR